MTAAPDAWPSGHVRLVVAGRVLDEGCLLGRRGAWLVVGVPRGRRLVEETWLAEACEVSV